VVETPPVAIDQVAPEGRKISLIFAFGNVHFREANKYKAIFKMDGRPWYENTFSVKLGQASDFTF
jgi:hypothetical protein